MRLISILIVLLVSHNLFAQIPVITTRFANPQINCAEMTYCVDVEFQSNMPDKRLFGMNTRFFYDTEELTFISFSNFEGGYGSFSPNPPNVSTGGLNTGEQMFSLAGAVTYVNGAIQLINSQAPPVYLATNGWTKLFSICFEIQNPLMLPGTEFFPSLIWDLKEDPSTGSFLSGSNGVVITVVATPPMQSAPSDENVEQFNWEYASNQGLPYGHPVSQNGVSPCILIQANDDDFTGNEVCSFEGGIAGNVLENDLVSGQYPNPSQISLIITDNGGLSNLTIAFTGDLVVPPATPAGNYTVVYRLTESGNSDNFDLAAIQLRVVTPEFQCPPAFTVCGSEPPFMLSGAVPGGGTFTGNGILNGVFHPAVAGIGDHFLTYCVVNPFTYEQYCCDFTVSVTEDQQVQLSMGWSGISSYIEPHELAMSDVLSPVGQQVSIIYNFDGIYWPDMGISTLGQWNPFSGYITKSSDIAVLPICGDALTQTPFELVAGWSIMPVLSVVPFNIEDLFAGQSGLVVVKEIAGTGVYWPAYNINTIGNLQPGKAYLVRLNNPETIDFSQQQKNVSTIIPDNYDQLNTPWNMVTFTPASHLVAFNLDENPLKDGDIIGGFTQDGFCAGLTELKQTSTTFALTLQGNDTYSDFIDGFVEEELISYTVYRPSTGELFNIEVTYNPDLNQGAFQTNGLSEVNTLKLTSTGTIIVDATQLIVYPNPTHGAFSIDGLLGQTKIKVLNSYGKEVSKTTTQLPASFDLSGLSRGVYLIRIEAEQKMYFRKLVVN